MDDPWADAPVPPLPKTEQRFDNVKNVSDNEDANAVSNHFLPKSPSANGLEEEQEGQIEEEAEVTTETEPSREENNGASEDEEVEESAFQSSPAQESHQWLSPQAQASDQVAKVGREENEEENEKEENGEEEQEDFDDFNDFDDPGSSSFPAPNPNLGEGETPGEGGDYDDGFGDFADFEEGGFDEPVDAEAGIGGNGLVEEPEPIKERWVCPLFIFSIFTLKMIESGRQGC